MLGLRFHARAFSSCGKWGPLFIAVRGPLTIAASLVAEHRLQTHRLQTRRLSNCGSRAQLLRGMWDLPRPGLEPVSPALAGRLSTTAPPGKPPSLFYKRNWHPNQDKMVSFETLVGHLLGLPALQIKSYTLPQYPVSDLLAHHAASRASLDSVTQVLSSERRWN